MQCLAVPQVISGNKYCHKKLNERRAPSGRKHQLLKYKTKKYKKPNAALPMGR